MRVSPIILVTGAGGQLGKEISDLAPAHPRYKFILKTKEELPLDQPVAMQRVFGELTPAFCINAAAYTAVDSAENADQHKVVYAVNAGAVHELGRCCNKYGTKLVHLSTDYVFDGQSRLPYKEEDQTAPLNIYGASKLEGETFALSYGNTVVLRTSWVYSSYGRNFVRTMTRLMKEKKEIRVVNDQFGSPTYARDIAGAIMKMIEFPEWQDGLFHFSNHGVTSWYEFAGMIRDFTGSECTLIPIPSAGYPTPAKRPLWSVLDTTKISRVFGIRPRNWQEALAECLEKLKSAGDW